MPYLKSMGRATRCALWLNLVLFSTACSTELPSQQAFTGSTYPATPAEIEVYGANVLRSLPIEDKVSSASGVTKTAESSQTVSPKKEQQKSNIQGWTVIAGQSLKQTLEAWAKRNSWTVQYNVPAKIPLGVSATFDGDFINASANLIRAAKPAYPNLTAEFWQGNKTLRVFDAEESSPQ